MALRFNKKYDKITQKQVVDDFVERLEISEDLKIKVYNSSGTETDAEVISKYKGYKEDGSNILVDPPIPNNILLRKKIRTRLIDVIKYILQALPSSLVLNLNKIQVMNIKINKGEKSLHIIVDSKGKSLSLYRAYMDRAQLDVSSMCSISSSGNTFVIDLNVDTPFLTDDYIALYLLKN